MKEEWRIVEIAPMYEVSNRGVIRNRETGRIIKIQYSNSYPRVGLNCNGVWLQKAVHRIVASAFVPGEKPGLFVNHIDGNKINYLPDNLEWVTHQENMAHSVRTGLSKPKRKFTEEEWDAELARRASQQAIETKEN